MLLEENKLYLHGRIAQRSGDHSRAVDIFRRLIAVDETRAEPALRLAESLRALGKSHAAQTVLGQAISTRVPREDLWDAWFHLAVVDLKLGPTEVLDAWPVAKEAEMEKTGRDRGAELRRVFERLTAGEAILINCGGTAVEDQGARAWEGDSLYVGGRTEIRYDGDLAESHDSEVYRTGRCFGQKMTRPGSYRVPLPVGEYRVVLHFTGTRKGRTFEVSIEGERVLPEYDTPFGAVETRAFDPSVTDGFLDIEFVHFDGSPIWDPRISAIEIHRR